jgi:hypothetical protein
MDCPQCHQQVPARLHWFLYGANGSVCPHCNAGLCPKAVCAVVLFLLSCALGDGALILLRHSGAQSWLAFGAFFVVFAAVYLVGMRAILRLQVKVSPDDRLRISGKIVPETQRH